MTHETFMQRVSPEPMSGCWLWLGAVNDGGYGRVCVAYGEGVQAHRFAYEAFVGPIPAGLQLDHLCRVRCCVNPDHLEPVTNRENALRGVGICALHAALTHCKHGHPFDAANTRITPEGWRECVSCVRISKQGQAARRKAARRLAKEARK